MMTLSAGQTQSMATKRCAAGAFKLPVKILERRVGMRFQSNRASCGPASLSNALATLGIHRTEEELITLCGQTPSGTSVRNLCRAIKQISTPEKPLFGDPVKWSKDNDATIGLWHYTTARGRPVILCVDSFEHWVV